MRVQQIASCHTKISKPALESMKMRSESHHRYNQIQQQFQEQQEDLETLKKSRLSLSVSRYRANPSHDQLLKSLKEKTAAQEEQLGHLQHDLQQLSQENSILKSNYAAAQQQVQELQFELNNKKKEFEQFLVDVSKEMNNRIKEFELLYEEQRQSLEHVQKDNSLFEILLRERDLKIQQLQEKLSPTPRALSNIDTNSKQELTKLLSRKPSRTRL